MKSSTNPPRPLATGLDESCGDGRAEFAQDGAVGLREVHVGEDVARIRPGLLDELLQVGPENGGSLLATSLGGTEAANPGGHR